MTSKEKIKRVVSHNNPPRIGFDFSLVSDIKNIPAGALGKPACTR